MNQLENILIPIAAFSIIVLVIYFIARYNYQTKKLIIESGKEFNFPQKRFPFCEIGLTLLGICIGIGLGLSIIPVALEVNDDITDLLTGSCILILGGIDLVAALI